MLLIANLTPEPRTVRIAGLTGEATVRRLNAATAALATADPRTFRAQFETLTAMGALVLTLAPFEVTRLDAPGPMKP